MHLLFWLALIYTCPTAHGEDLEVQELPPLILGQGEQRLLKIAGLRKYSLGGSVVRAIHLPPELGDRDSLLLRGVEAGNGDLWVWKREGTPEHRPIRVEKWAQEVFPKPLQSLLSQLKEVEILATGSQATLRGTVLSHEEAARIAALKREHSVEITDETVLSDSLLDDREARIRAWIQSSGHSDRIQVEQRNGGIHVRGQPASPGEAQAWTRQIHARFALADVEWAQAEDSSQTIFFRVFLLELRKDKMRSLGIQWPESVPGAFQITPSGIHDALSLEVALNALAREGSARILSKPELAVRAPGDAELFAGGELPIHNRTVYQSNVMWKPFGLTLKLKVIQATASRVRLEILTEVSRLDPTIASDQVPGFRSNRMRTQVDATFGRPLLLSGLLQENMSQQASGLPGLRNIPVLGALFGSEDFLKERSELVAILLPQAMTPEPSLASVHETLPAGPVPPARNWVSPSEQRKLERSPDYPWNAFGEN